ncbi:hypothetical protein OESDEN_10314 [Oesophagostomum dentatum]|uniref:Uncharacterized protein n=1 Tax=Oesophagostomum dentatum TaxID=61180 RepID=A0A0B1T228_OESDE|nr:hypothetical protein OESDEN_10314 [Oesophagostomum dentatum]
MIVMEKEARGNSCTQKMQWKKTNVCKVRTQNVLQESYRMVKGAVCRDFKESVTADPTINIYPVVTELLLNRSGVGPSEHERGDATHPKEEIQQDSELLLSSTVMRVCRIEG